MGIYTSRTVRPNRIGLPSDLMDTKSFKNVLQGHTLWRMHDTRKVSCVMWKDRKSMLLIFTHALPVQAPCKFLGSLFLDGKVQCEREFLHPYFYWCMPQICREWMLRTSYVRHTHAKYEAINGGTNFSFSFLMSWL